LADRGRLALLAKRMCTRLCVAQRDRHRPVAGPLGDNNASMNATAFLVMNLETLAERLLRLLRYAVATLCEALVGHLQPHMSSAA
jgi:hypothetical protein